jgi:cytoskeletal protein RodZ
VYAWIWRKLPGNAYAKLSQSLVLLVAVGALLWYVIFPWATPLLPFDDVQVSDGTNQSGPAQQDPNAVIPGDNGAPDDIPYTQHSNNPEPTRSR